MVRVTFLFQVLEAGVRPEVLNGEEQRSSPEEALEEFAVLLRFRLRLELCAEVGDGVRVEAAYRGGVRASTSPPKE